MTSAAINSHSAIDEYSSAYSLVLTAVAGLLFLAGLTLATTSRVFWESRFLRLDTLLAFFLWAGFFCFLKAWLKEADKRLFLLAYFCFALATLTKGPIGLALPGLAIVICVAMTGRWQDIKQMRPIAG